MAGTATLTVRRESEPSAEVLAQWDRLVATRGGTDVTQLSAWATIRREVGYTPMYLFVYRDDTVLGGALLLYRRVFGLLGIGYLPYGPLVDPNAEGAPVATSLLVEELCRFAAGCSMMFVQPPEGAHDVSDALLARGFRRSSAGIAPAGSYRLDLTRPLDEIRGGFSKRLKSWTNRWQAKGVHVRVGDESDLPLLRDLMEFTGARQGFQPPPLDYIRTLYRELSRGGHAAVFVGEVHGQPVSADIVTVVGGMVRGRLGGFDGSGEAGKLSVPAAVRWEIIQWGQRSGHRYLDFGGLPERMLHDMIDLGIHTSEEWPSAQRGKLAFNGSPFRYPTPVELVRPLPTRITYDYLQRNERGAKVVAAAKTALRSGRGKPPHHEPA